MKKVDADSANKKEPFDKESAFLGLMWRMRDCFEPGSRMATALEDFLYSFRDLIDDYEAVRGADNWPEFIG